MARATSFLSAQDRSGWLLHESHPNTTLCSDPLESMRSGVWKHGADAICSARQPALRVLCSSNASDVHASIKYAQGEVRDTRERGLLWRAANCSLRHFSAAAACKLLREAGGMLAIGDSTMRHLFMGFLSVLSDDYERGAVSQEALQRSETLRRASNDTTVKCQGDLQFSSNLCRHVRDLATSPIGHCPDAALRFAEIRHAPDLERALREPNSSKDAVQLAEWLNAAPSRSYVLVRLGVHENFNASAVESALRAMFARLPTARRLRLLFVAPSAVGPAKPKQYLFTQGNLPVQNFTQRLRGFCHENGCTLADPFEVSRGAHSFDGTHYGMELNVLLAHVLLNFFARDSGMRSFR